MGANTLPRKMALASELHGGPDGGNDLTYTGDGTYTGTNDFSGGIKADTIAESTAATGVTIDGVLCKDSAVNGLVNVIDAGASTTLTVAQSGSLVVLNSSDVVTLPAAASAAGVVYDFLAVTVATQGPRIDPAASEVLQLQGTDLTGGNYAEAAAIGDSLRIYCNGTKWFTVFAAGTWTYEGA